MKKMLALLLAAIMVVSMVSVVMAEESGTNDATEECTHEFVTTKSVEKKDDSVHIKTETKTCKLCKKSESVTTDEGHNPAIDSHTCECGTVPKDYCKHNDKDRIKKDFEYDSSKTTMDEHYVSKYVVWCNSCMTDVTDISEVDFSNPVKEPHEFADAMGNPAKLGVCSKCGYVKEELMYMIRSGKGSCVMYTLTGNPNNLEAAEFSAEFMMLKSADNAMMEFSDGYNYIPLRFFADKFGAEDKTDDFHKKADESEYTGGYEKYKEAFEKYVAEENIKKSVYSWKKLDGMMTVVLFTGEKTYIFVDGKSVSETNPGDAKAEGLGTSSVIIREERTYVPLRTPELLTGVKVMYDDSTKLAGIIKSVEDDASEAIFNVAKDRYSKYLNHGYVNYSKMYLNDSNEICEIKDSLAVNRFDNILVYVDKDNKLCAQKLDKNGNMTGSVDVIKNDKLYGTVVFDGLNIYAVEIANPGDYSGRLVSAKLTVKANEFDIEDEKIVYEGLNYSLQLCGDRLYFINETENRLKYVNRNDGEVNNETVNLEPQNRVFAYAVVKRADGFWTIAGDYNKNIIWGDAESTVGDNNISDGQFYLRNAVANHDFKDVDGIKILFYYVTEEQNGSNQVWYLYEENGKINTKQITNYNSGTKVRNLVILNGELYASVSGSISKICDINVK